ncbi:hypothetical protein M1D80_13155 [Phyllobacteriaceae bacterium JZ32]
MAPETVKTHFTGAIAAIGCAIMLSACSDTSAPLRKVGDPVTGTWAWTLSNGSCDNGRAAKIVFLNNGFDLMLPNGKRYPYSRNLVLKYDDGIVYMTHDTLRRVFNPVSERARVHQYFSDTGDKLQLIGLVAHDGTRIPTPTKSVQEFELVKRPD